jgi:hypothetical protein
MDILYGPTHKELNKNVNSATALLQSLWDHNVKEIFPNNRTAGNKTNVNFSITDMFFYTEIC